MSERNKHLLVRDDLGVNKLFVAVRGRVVESSNYLVDLLRRGYRLNQISSVPSGHAMWIDVGAQTMKCQRYSRLCFNNGSDDAGSVGEACVASIRSALDTTFRRIRAAVADREVYVTMSGGLDSTIIALLAQSYLPRVRGVVLSLQRDKVSPVESEDVQFARRVARDLAIPLTVLEVTGNEVHELLHHALTWGQDWRDFNVHCALVNAAIGRALANERAQQGLSGKPLLLTGDTMNEMMADYEPVWYGDQEIYQLPRLRRGQLRRFLVTGLDSGDREVGVLAKKGFTVLQPYAMCAAAYLSVPAGFLERPNAKQELARRVISDRIPRYVLQRPKVRAQAASSSNIGGTMAVLLDAGIDGGALRKRWCELFELPPDELSGLIRAGVYRYSTDLYSWPSTDQQAGEKPALEPAWRKAVAASPICLNPCNVR